MANALSYNQVIDIMSDIAQRHYLINTFMLGKDWELENNQDIVYPLLQVYPETARLPQVNGDYKTINITLVCKVIDLVRQAEENERDVHSDCLRIAQDVVNEINQHPYYQRSNANLIGDIDFTSLEEFEDDFTAGWTFNLNLQLINNNSYCGLPFEEIPGYSVNGPSFSGEIYSVQYLTCDTVTACTNLTEYIVTIIEQNSSAIWSGGTVVLNSTFEGNLTVEGNTYVEMISGDTAYFTNYFSGGTSLETIITNIADANEDITRVQNGTNTTTGGTDNYPSVNVVDSPSFNNLTFSGTATGGSIIGSSISATTFYSGGTNLEQIILNVTGGVEDITRVQPGTNINTGGTDNYPTVNLVDSPSINNLTFSGTATGGNVYATQLSGGTIFSGGTDLSSIFAVVGSGDVTRVQNGTNTTTGGTANLPSVNIVDSPSFNNITFSGTATGGNISANSISATTFYSGSTNLQNIINTVNSRLAEGISTGIISGGTLSINVGDNTKFDIAAGLGYIVDYTVYPQSTQLLSWATQTGLTVTNLATSFATDVAINAAGTILQQNSYTREELRSIIFLGGLDHSTLTSIRNIFKITVPTYGVGSSVKDLTLALGDINLDGNVFSSNGVNLKINKSAGSTFSYGRNYQNNQNDPNVISQSATTQQVFRHAFNNGSGIASFQAEGTDINPDSYDNGSGVLQVVPNNKYTIQRILMFSNSQNVFIQYGQTVYNTKDDAIANLAAASYTNLAGLKTAMVRGYLIVKQGSTDLSTSDTVFVNGDRFGGIGGGTGVAAANYYTTGSTLSGTSIVFDRNDLASAYSVQLSAITGNVNISGNLSATTFYSGSTNLESIFALAGSGDVTRVQPGSNIATGGTGNLPIVSLSDSPSVNNLTFSGTATGGNISAGSVSATTFFSGSTPLATVISSLATGDITRVQNGLNTYTGGTGNLPTINISAATLDYLVVTGTTVLAETSASTFSIINSGSTTREYTDYSGNRIKTGVTNSVILAGTGNTINNNLRNVLIAGVNLTATTSNSSYFSTAYSNGINVNACDLSFAISDETTSITSGTSKLTIYAPYAFTITNVYASLSTSGSTASTFNVKNNGTTIFSTKITIDANEFHSKDAVTPAVITGSTVAQFDKLTVDIDASGSGATGAKIYINGTRT